MADAPLPAPVTPCLTGGAARRCARSRQCAALPAATVKAPELTQNPPNPDEGLVTESLAPSPMRIGLYLSLLVTDHSPYARTELWRIAAETPWAEDAAGNWRDGGACCEH